MDRTIWCRFFFAKCLLYVDPDNLIIPVGSQRAVWVAFSPIIGIFTRLSVLSHLGGAPWHHPLCSCARTEDGAAGVDHMISILPLFLSTLYIFNSLIPTSNLPIFTQSIFSFPFLFFKIRLIHTQLIFTTLMETCDTSLLPGWTGGHTGPQRQSWSSIQLWKSFVKRMTIRVFGILASASSTSPEEAMVIANRSNVASNSMASSKGSVASSAGKREEKCWPVHRGGQFSGVWQLGGVWQQLDKGLALLPFGDLRTLVWTMLRLPPL